MTYEKTQQHCGSIPVLSVPRDMLVGCPGGCGCCSPEWGRSLAEMCGLVACWVGWVLTGDLSGTKTGAVGPTGHSEKKEHSMKILGQECPSALLNGHFNHRENDEKPLLHYNRVLQSVKLTKIFFLGVPQDYLSPVQGWKLHVGEAADFLLEYWKAGADELPLSGGRRTAQLQEFFKKKKWC